MNNKKVQAHMQIDVSFLGDTTKLVKQLQNDFSRLDLNSGVSAKFKTSLEKGFKEVYSNLDKMVNGLSQKGLSGKQYTEFFNSMNAKLQESIKFARDLKGNLQGIYNSDENKKAIKQLEEYRKKLEEINKLAKNQKAAATRQGTAKTKLKEETGLDYEVSKKMLNAIAERRNNKQKPTKAQQDWLEANGLTEEKLRRALELLKQINAQTNKMNQANQQAKSLTGSASVDAAQKAVSSKIASLESFRMTEETFKNNISLTKQLTDGVELLDEVVGEQLPDAFRIGLGQGQTEAERLAKAGMTLNEIFAQFGIAFTAANVVRGLQDLFKSAFDFYKSLDSALNQIYIVSNLTSREVDSLKTSYINMSKETGMALDDVTRAAVLFYQQGLNTDEVTEMTRVTAQFAKVAGIDATDAADKLTAAVNGYCLAAEDAASVADKFNQVAAVSAADINELSTAFSKAAAQANQAGVSMDNYLAYIATMEEATREAPENIGTSLKTIFSRMQQIKSGGSSEDGETDVNQVETALRSVGIALRDANNELRDLEEVFDELGPKWNSLDRNTQAYLGTIIAGTRQQSRFITLMQNWDRVLELAAESENSAGKQALMHAKAMESIESKVQQMNVAWQEFVSNLTDSTVIKSLVDLMTKFLNTINSGTKPITLLGLGLTMLGKQINNLQLPIDAKAKEFFKKIKDGVKHLKDGTKAVRDYNIDAKTKKQQLKSVGGLISDKEASLANKQQKADALAGQIVDLQYQKESKQLSEEQTAEIDKQIAARNRELAVMKTRITNDQEDLKLLKEQEEAIKRQKTGREEALQTIGKIGVALQVVSLAISDWDANLSGVMSSVGSGMEAFSAFATGDWLRGITATVKMAMEIGNTVANWEKNIEKKLTDGVKKVGDTLQSVTDLTTSINSTRDLIDEYNKLNSKMVKTTAEQERLNSVVQEMADSYDGVEAIADAYGNLSVNIDDVNNALNELYYQRDQAKKELATNEMDGLLSATSGVFNDNTVQDFTEQLFKTEGANYKKLLVGVQDGLKDESRVVSKNVAKAFSSNLKNSMMKEMKNNSFSYIGEGFAQGLIDMETALNDALDGQDWNELYGSIDYLQNNINNMSFTEAQEYLANFYDNWEGRTKLTQEQWDLLVDSINNTIFENKSLLAFYDKVNMMGQKMSGEYYDKQAKNIEDDIDRLKKQTAWYEEHQGLATTGGALAGAGAGAAAGAGAGAAIGALGGPIGAGAGAIIGGIVGLVGGAVGAYAASNTDEAKRLKAMKKALEELEKQKEEYIKTLMEEHKTTLYTEEDAEKWYTAMSVTAEMMSNLRMETQNYIGTIEGLYDMENMTAEQAEDYANVLGEVLPQLENVQGNAAKTNSLIHLMTEQMDEDKPELNAKLQEVIDEAFNNLELPSSFTFTQIAGELDSMSSDLRTINKLMDEFEENGALTLDSFKELAGILDSINVEQLYAVSDLDAGINYVDQYIDALHNLDLAFSQNNGMITMNGEALKSLQNIQEIQAQAQITTLKNELIAKKTQVEAEIGYIDAQIAGVDAAIAALEAAGGAKIKTSEIEDKANKATQESFQNTIDNLQSNYSTDVQNLNTWTQAVLTDLSTATEAWGRYWKAAAGEGEENLDDLRNKAKTASDNIKWEGSKTLDIKKKYGSSLNANEQAELLADLNKYRDNLTNLKARYQASLELYDTQIGLLESMQGADLSRLGLDGEKEAEKLEQYIGKLKEIYNILNRIQMLEHRLSTLDTYADVSVGETYGKLLQERLDYNEQLMDQYEFLVTEQKKFTNGYKDFIGTVEGLEGVFDFDKFGQIIINWEKYNQLQDVAAQGEVTLKEKADDVYETYTQMMDDLQGYFDKYIAYLKQVIDLQQEMVDSYMDVQDKAADAIKEIYQKILDTKLDAIDQEKDAIEELRKAREQARKDQENAKAVSGLQTNIQRAMMDTSGASDSNLIKAQQDLDDKLSEIAEDKYSQMLDDIIGRLEEEQDALQREFDEMFDHMEWLYEVLDDEFMQDRDKLQQLFEQTDEWNQASPLRRKELVQDFDTKFNTYMSGLQGGRSIYDVWQSIENTRGEISKLDEALKTSLSSFSSSITTTIQNWQASNSGGGSSGGSGGGGSTPSKSGTTLNPTGGNSGGAPQNQPSGADAFPYKGGLEAMNGKTVELDKSTVYTLYDNTNTAANSTYKSPWLYEKNVDIKSKPTWSDKAQAWLVKVSGLDKPYVKASADAHGQGITKYFHDRGWGKSGIKYREGGFADFTGPAWLDGTPDKPEAVLNALQTEHFIQFTNALDKLMSGPNSVGNTANSVNIESISFQVESMSSEEDGEAAFNAFVNKFKEIGSQSGIKINSFKNTL